MSDGNDDSEVNHGRRKFLSSGVRAGAAGLVAAQFPMISIAQEPEILEPVYQVHSSSAWIVGQSDFLDDSGLGRGARVNKNLDTPFYFASLVKHLVDLAVLRAERDGKISWDTPLTMSEYALTRSSNSAFANVTKDNLIFLDGKETKTVPLEIARPWQNSFSLNDVTIASVETLANGGPVPEDISMGRSRGLERKFIEDYITPILAELGMANTQIKTVTGLPVRSGFPAQNENYTTHRDVMRLVNTFLSEFPDELGTYQKAQEEIRRAYKDPKTGRWHEETATCSNAVSLLENSAEHDDERRASIPTEGIIGLKSGVKDLSLWQFIHIFDLKTIGGQGHMAFVTTGDTNETYATHPKGVFDNAVELIKPTIRPESQPEIRRDEDFIGSFELYPQA